MSARYLAEVEARLKQLPKLQKPQMWLMENYIGGGESKLKYLNVKIPLVRAAHKKPYSFSHLPIDEQWKIWNYIWHHSDIFEVMLGASYFAASRPFSEMLEHRREVLSWIERVDNWGHSDELSSHYAKLLEHDSKLFMPVFHGWSDSKNPWFKRQAMVGLLFYSRFRKKYPPAKTILKFIDRHIDDKHYYVQKGVGWALRECWNVYPKETYAYLTKNAARIPAGGWTAATEKLPAADKAKLMKIRKAGRSSKSAR